MARVNTAGLISISEANKIGVSGLVREAEAGHDKVVLRNNKPVAALVSIRRLEELQQLEDDLLDMSVAAARALTTGPRRHSLDDVLAQLGYARDQLSDLPE